MRTFQKNALIVVVVVVNCTTDCWHNQPRFTLLTTSLTYTHTKKRWVKQKTWFTSFEQLNIKILIIANSK